jgi:hypothetical protein
VHGVSGLGWLQTAGISLLCLVCQGCAGFSKQQVSAAHKAAADHNAVLYAHSADIAAAGTDLSSVCARLTALFACAGTVAWLQVQQDCIAQLGQDEGDSKPGLYDDSQASAGQALRRSAVAAAAAVARVCKRRRGYARRDALVLATV